MNWNGFKRLGVMVMVASSTLCAPVKAEEPMTITERQTALMKTVNSAEKSGELTLKEAVSLRKSEAKVVAKEVKMKGKNGGKLSYANIAEIERDLNSMSNRLHKQQLAKRVVK